MISEHNTQDGSKDEVDKVQRVRIEPERTGWARIYDLVRQVDKDRVADIKEDIDTLLVFVSSLLYARISKLTYHRPVYSLPLSRHSSSNLTRTCNNSLRISQTKSSSIFQIKSRVSLSTGTSSIPPCQTSPLHPSRGLRMQFSSTSSGSSASSSLL